mmetsp:Transcript_3106/g.5264  ORF Transcript_3106/g.5264 Transcript_3106/m.5264 type:complete len:337 (-) Transcript_3106:418-1428(-)
MLRLQVNVLCSARTTLQTLGASPVKRNVFSTHQAPFPSRTILTASRPGHGASDTWEVGRSRDRAPPAPPLCRRRAHSLVGVTRAKTFCSQGGDARIAVLIDAENAQVLKAQVFKGLIDEISKYGTPVVKRCYGDFTKPNMQPWKALVLEHAITVEQQFAYTSGKNSSDVRLAIDAMDILYSPLYNVEAFFLISSDSDFAPLASRLRMAGKKVYAAGNKHTPEGFRSSVDKFIILEKLGDENVPSENRLKDEGMDTALAVENSDVPSKSGLKDEGMDTALTVESINVPIKNGVEDEGKADIEIETDIEIARREARRARQQRRRGEKAKAKENSALAV